MSGFLFDRDFDAELAAEAVVPERAPQTAPDPLALAQERDALSAASFAAGVAQGTAEAEARLRAGFESEIAATLAALVPEIAALTARHAQHRHRSSMDLAQMCLFLAERLLPEMQSHFGARRIEAFCRRAARLAEGPEGAEIRLSPAMLAEIGPRLGLLRSGSQAPVRLIADPSLAPGAAFASWRQGHAEFAVEKLHAELLATLSSIAQTPAPDGQ